MPIELTNHIKSLALSMGFACVGIAPAGEVPHAQRLLAWLEGGQNADMDYMQRNLPLRRDPSKLVPGAKSVICLVAACDGETEGSDSSSEGSIARYAQGADYHKVLKKKCIALMDSIRRDCPEFLGRAFVDAAPVMERSLAVWAGLGWIGDNGCLIVPGLGSGVLLCEIICNLELVCDKPAEGSCGHCGQCVKACPTGALLSDGVVDAARCISYLTIEHRGTIDPLLWPKMGTHLFGCDACQQACPHNQGSQGGVACRHASHLDLSDVLAWTETDWDLATRGRALRRASWPMFLRNAIIAAGNSGDSRLLEPLDRLAAKETAGLYPLGPLTQWARQRLTKGI